MQETSTPNSKDWYADSSGIGLVLPNGVGIRPTAAEIIAAEYKNRHTIRGEDVPRRPSEALPQIQFTRYPPDIHIRLIRPSPDLSRPAACFVTLSTDQRPPVPIPEGADQILVDQEWFPLAGELMEQLFGILKSAGIKESGSISLKQYLTLAQQDSALVTITDSDEGVLAVVPAATVATETPTGLRAQLYPYQHDGFLWLSRIADEGLGCILGDDMGLGKTLQVITLLLREAELRKMPSLVVAPATLLENWRREIARFAPDLSTVIHRGHGRSGFPKTLRTYNVVLTSYDTALRDISILEMVKWNIVVLDEAQAIKNPAAQRTVTLKTLPRRVGVAVSGTPVENRLRDLWSLMDFAVPGFLGTLGHFESQYADNTADAANLEPLVTPLILRRLIGDVAADLPERIYIPQPVELSMESATEYDSIRADIVTQYGKAATLVALTKLRMYCTHPFLLNNHSGDPLPHSSKYARLLEILDEIFVRGEKVLVFTSYTQMADILAEDIRRRYGVPCEVIDGRVDVNDRQPTVDNFAEVMGSAVLVLNPKAAGTGLNITAANHVIHYNLEWNPAVEDQATARVYRRGQTRPVTVHRLFHPGTVEEVIDERTERKRDIAAHAVIGIEGDQNDLADIMRAMELSPVTQRNTNVG